MNATQTANPDSAGLSPEARRLLETRLGTKDSSGHALIAATLRALGLTHVYGISGTPIHETLAACSRAGLRAIGVRHQQAGVLMAAAQNFLAGGLRSAAIISAGPAVTNALTGALVAWENCWPVVILAGRRPLQTQGTGVFQELDGVPVFAPVTKWSRVVRTTEDLPASLVEAAKMAVSGRPGPVFLDLTEEVLKGSAPRLADCALEHDPVPDTIEGDLDRAGDIFRQAERPLLIAGKGIRWNDAHQVLREIVELLHMPFIASPMARGLLSDEHPLCFSAVGGLAQRDADAVLVVGARLNWQFRFGHQFPRTARVVHIDVHPPEIGRNVATEVGLVGDASRVLRWLCEQLRRAGAVDGLPARREAWIAALRRRRAEVAAEVDRLAEHDGLPMSPYRMMREIRNFLPADAVTILDGHVSMLVGQEMIPSRQPLSRLTVGTNGCLGVGLPFALGAKLCLPDRLVVAVCGDSAFGFSAMELETAMRHRIPIIVIVANNQGLWGGLIQKGHYPPGHERVAMFGEGIRYEKLGEAFGCHAEFVDRPAGLQPALERAAAAGKAACINVQIAHDTQPPEQARF